MPPTETLHGGVMPTDHETTPLGEVIVSAHVAMPPLSHPSQAGFHLPGDGRQILTEGDIARHNHPVWYGRGQRAMNQFSGYTYVSTEKELTDQFPCVIDSSTIPDLTADELKLLYNHTVNVMARTSMVLKTRSRFNEMYSVGGIVLARLEKTWGECDRVVDGVPYFPISFTFDMHVVNSYTAAHNVTISVKPRFSAADAIVLRLVSRAGLARVRVDPAIEAEFWPLVEASARKGSGVHRVECIGTAWDNGGLSIQEPREFSLPLQDYQRKALGFMVERETARWGLNSFRVLQFEIPCMPTQYADISTGEITLEEPPVVRGGMLALDVGLGKTAICIALCLREIASTNLPEHHTSSTLVVCPPMLVRQWVEEIERFTGASGATVIEFNAKNKEDITSAAFVVTSYHRLVSSAKRKTKDPNKNPWAWTWHRVIIDESHQARNPETARYKHLSNLKADRKWCVTGTPFCRDYIDLYNQLSLIGAADGEAGLQRHRFPKGGVKDHPLRPAYIEPHYLGLTRVLYRSACIRYTKDQKVDGRPIVALPEISIGKIYSPLVGEALEMYQCYRRGVEQWYRQSVSDGDMPGKDRLLHLRQHILRLRMICAGYTGKECRVSLVVDYAMGVSRDLVLTSLGVNANGSTSAEDAVSCCAICYDVFTDPVATRCKHIFCEECIHCVFDMAEGEGTVCPMCRAPIKVSGLVRVEKADEDGKRAKRDNTTPSRFDQVRSSEKIDSLVDVLDDPYSTSKKVIVFSSFSKVLSAAGEALAGGPIRVFSYRIKDPVATRAVCLNDFKVCVERAVLLLSIRTSSDGLNLACADTVVFMDPCLSESAEIQAVGRAHRLGQKNTVNVIKLYTPSTVEVSGALSPQTIEDALSALGVGNTH